MRTSEPATGCLQRPGEAGTIPKNQGENPTAEGSEPDEKILVAIFFAALAAVFIVLIFKPDLLLAGTPIDATPAVWPGGILAINRAGEMACFQ